MNYLLFNNQILVGDGSKVRRVGRANDLQNILGSIEQARLCVVDIDVLIAASVEFPVAKKDSILVRKFKEYYQHESYIIQDERIDNNLFQVIGIKEKKVREVYSLIASDKVELFVPYAIALRNALIGQTVDFNKTIVFVDDIGAEWLLTVLDGLKFSRTRVIVKNGEDILPEIKRSQIDFFKKMEEFVSKKSTDFVIIVNDQALAASISKNSEKLQVEYLNITYPALEGLKTIEASINYRLPEDNLRKRREVELRKRIKILIVSFCCVAFSFFYSLFNRLEIRILNGQCESAKEAYQQLDERLNTLDKEIYRVDLRRHKTLNYGVSYLAILGIIPASYVVNTFRIYRKNKWNIEMTLFVGDDGSFESIPRIRILKNVEIKDVFLNNQPGKHLHIIL